jgi:hypothetical protein
VPAERREQASVGARASWNSCMSVGWDLLLLFFHLRWVRGVCVALTFSVFSRLPQFIFFVGRSSLLLLYKLVIVIFLLFHFFFPKGISHARA